MCIHVYGSICFCSFLYLFVCLYAFYFQDLLLRDKTTRTRTQDSEESWALRWLVGLWVVGAAVTPMKPANRRLQPVDSRSHTASVEKLAPCIGHHYC